MIELPPPVPQPCNDCPWRRNATPGWLGPFTAEEWCQTAHGEAPVACHKTIRVTNDLGYGDWENPSMRQCMGMAIFRNNICKSPHNPTDAANLIEEGDKTQVFSWDDEFIAYHEGEE